MSMHNTGHSPCQSAEQHRTDPLHAVRPVTSWGAMAEAFLKCNPFQLNSKYKTTLVSCQSLIYLPCKGLPLFLIWTERTWSGPLNHRDCFLILSYFSLVTGSAIDFPIWPWAIYLIPSYLNSSLQREDYNIALTSVLCWTQRLPGLWTLLHLDIFSQVKVPLFLPWFV